MVVSHMIAVQERRLAKTLDQLMAEGSSEGNSHFTLDYHSLSVEVGSTSTSTSVRGRNSNLSSSHSTTSTSKRSRTPKEPAQEVLAKGTVFPGAPVRLNS